MTNNESNTLLLKEVSPNTGAIIIDLNDSHWQNHPISDFEKCIVNKNEYKKLPKAVRSFYRRQNELIKELIDVDKKHIKNNETAYDDEVFTNHHHRENPNIEINIRNPDELLAKIVFSINLILLVAKAAAAGLSGSLSIISSLMDSAIDIVSGTIMWWTARRMKKFNPYVYPQGRQRLEPISIIVLSVIMAVTSIQIIRESTVAIIAMATAGKKPPVTDNISISIISVTIAAKIVLWVVCYRYGKSESSAALTQDSRNDVFSNAVALICSACSNRLNVDNLKYLDPCGAILIAIYIMVGWIKTGCENVKTLTGITASPEFLQKVTFIAVNHHPHIKYIDTVRAFHFGTNFLVEVDIVLDENMILKLSHDIGESLQKRLEDLDEIERCFVHLDFEVEHDPKKEHKVV